MIVAIQPQDINRVWDQVGPMLENSVTFSNSETNSEIIKENLEKGIAILLAVIDGKEFVATFILEPQFYPLKKALHLSQAAGIGMDSWDDEVFETILSIAKENEYDSIIINGRDGWERKMKQYGFAKTHVSLERVV